MSSPFLPYAIQQPHKLAFEQAICHPDAAAVILEKIEAASGATLNVGAVNGTGVSAVESTKSHHTRITLTNVVVTMTDMTSNGSIGNLKIYDMPAGVVSMRARTNLSFVVTTGIDADAVLKHSVGTAPSATNDTLNLTKANLVPSTNSQLADSAGTATGSSVKTAIVALTDSSGGTPGDTIADVPNSYTEATLANQLSSLAVKINELIARQTLEGNGGATTIDGSVTPVDIYLNLSVANADTTANSTVTINGSVDIEWSLVN